MECWKDGAILIKKKWRIVLRDDPPNLLLDMYMEKLS